MSNNELVLLAEKLLQRHEELGTWELVSRHYSVPKISLWRIVFDNYEPKKNRTRLKLGLSEIVEHKIRRDDMGRFIKRIK